MKYISKALLLGASLLTLGLVLPSCERKKAFDLEQYESVSLQISSFSMSTKQEGVDLSQYFFAISHGKEGGVITNRRPLPYNLDLKEVSLSVVAISPTTKLYVALDDGEYQAYKSGETKLDIPHTAESIRIKVDLPKSSREGAEILSSYIYTVHLTRYQYDPRTVSWEQGVASLGRMLPGITTSGVVPYGKGHLFYDDASRQCYQVTYSEVGIPSLSPIALSGLPAAERITTLDAGAGIIYALTDQGRLYKLVGTMWQVLAVDKPVASLLAVLPSGREGVEPALFLLLDGDKPALASYVENKLSISSEALPEYFPTKGDYHKAFVSHKDAIGSYAYLLGTSYQDGKLYRTSWYITLTNSSATKGGVWMPLSVEEVKSAPLTGASFLMSEDIYYRLEATATGLVVLTSEDAKSWVEGLEQALDNLDGEAIAGRNILAWTTPANTISLLSGVGNTGASSAALWIGTPLRNVAE